MTSYMTKERMEKLKQTSLDIGEREHHKELLDLNLIVTVDDNFDAPAWFVDFMAENIRKYVK